ncbi:hypothetical protein BDV95DRAFT_605750 [Massariosphaeria phaeospora]|uniref:WDR59/RTC1-like RING zinc finger domain-containing protein n=1 Tax=Massariosphaeria phaeospora TaxID=100035 RepID=A0A7C8IHN7_9PLEO|nr:hypothetical protein BDV95DRAFT_605750 [Massariosphaeria phaeospora]
MATSNSTLLSAFDSPTFDKDASIAVPDDYTAASISPSGRDVVLAGKAGLFIIDLDNPYATPRQIRHKTAWEVADVQWSPFAERADWVASTDNQKAVIFSLSMKHDPNKAPVYCTLHAHTRTITDINFSAHDPNILATCAVDSYVHTWDVRAPWKPTSAMVPQLKDPYMTFADFEAGATQVKWNRKDRNIIASSHDRFLRIWDMRNGARPLTTVQAHGTKIYGIDWHRTDATKIITCSLDKTIKVWDRVGIRTQISTPLRVIHTDYPVLRARHTPFPNGIMAMPQRGSAGLKLYKRATDTVGTAPTVTQPAHTFKAHDEDPLKTNADGTRLHEFLWRSRGSIEDGVDNRQFQLISWGADRFLRLHSVNADTLLEAVGFEQGGRVQEEPLMTRKGALYITYRDGPPVEPQSPQAEPSDSRPFAKGSLASLLRKPPTESTLTGLIKRDAENRATMTAGTVRHSKSHKVTTEIKWIGGVNISTKAGPQQFGQARALDEPDLATEITRVSQRYPNVFFDKVDIKGRTCTVELKGPWGDSVGLDESEDKHEGRSVTVRFILDFPSQYPTIVGLDTKRLYPVEIDMQRTIGAIDKRTSDRLKSALQAIAKQHAIHGRECLEAIICYALGDRNLEESMEIAVEPRDSVLTPPLYPTSRSGGEEEESSSEDDEDDESEAELTTNFSRLNANANIPVPIQISARFSLTSALVMARLPTNSSSRAFGSDPLRLPRHLRQGLDRDEIFESFGRLAAATSGSGSATSSAGSWETSSSSSSSGSDHDVGARIGNFLPPLAWQKAGLRHQTKASLPSSIGAVKAIKTRSIISIMTSSVEQFIPSKQVLAQNYWIFGDGPNVCLHNSEVARKHGFEDLADIWFLCKLILSNEVPLEILPQRIRRDQVLILARRALVRIKRKDSGLDLQFDEADTVTNPKLKGRIKWGNHSVVTWLIPALFEHFERTADTQMLAMLSCVFSEPAAREGVTSTMAKMRQSDLPMSMEAPAFSLDYFPSADAAWSLFKPSISLPSTPAHSRYAAPGNEFGWHRLTRPLDIFGSHGSSNGPWGNDTLPSEPVMLYSTGNTPPILNSRASSSRAVTLGHTSYSTSTEQPHTFVMNKKPSTANFASAFATLSKPFANAMSSSPTVKLLAHEEFSTSAPTSVVTWGATTFYSNESNELNLEPSRSKHRKRASFAQPAYAVQVSGHNIRVDDDYASDSDSEYESFPGQDGASEYTAPLTPREDGEEATAFNIKVTLKNQDRFDDEGGVSAPLLDLSKEWLYRAWREQYAEMLGCWNLISQRAEVLKFNGLVGYFPPDGSIPAEPTLAIKKEGEKISPVSPTSSDLPRSPMLAPPPFKLIGQLGRSPSVSPRNFNFNPEASEFTPGIGLTPVDDIPAPLPEILISPEQYLRLSIAAPSPPANRTTFDGAAESKINLAAQDPRPSISRAQSNISTTSVAVLAGQDPAPKADSNGSPKAEVVYSCTICWLRVSGRFYLCPACGHVAHFECMDDELGVEEGECVVGCGCGCGFEEEDIKDLMIEQFRRWEEKGGWLPDEDVDGDADADADADAEEDHAGVERVRRWSQDVARKRERRDAKWKGKGKAKARE